MRKDSRPGFVEFVAREHDDLRRLALLLEGDTADAEELLRGVLVSVRSRWEWLTRRGDPRRAAWRLLVRRVLTRRPGDSPRTSGWVDDPDAGWDTDRHDDLRQALSALPVPTRAAVVLSLWAELTDGEIADLLRLPEDAVRGEVAAGLPPLRAALVTVAAPWRPGSRLPDDAELRAELTALADDEPPPVDPVVLATETEHEVSVRRRRRWPVAAVAAAVVVTAVVVAVPALVEGSPAPGDAPPSPSTDRPQPSGVASTVDISELPTRGPLAGDRAFLDGLVRQPWESDATGDHPIDVTTAEESRRVLFAGDVAAGRWALVVGRPEPVNPVTEGIGGPFITDQLYMAWFTGPRGAAPEDMELSTWPYALMPGMTPALLDPLSGTLVVVAAPGDAVEVSERVEVDADGTDSRTWTPLPVTGGIAVGRLEPVDLAWTWAVNYRIFRDEGLVGTAPPDGLLTGMAQPPQLPETGIEFLRGAPDEEGRRAAEWAAFIGLSALGAPTDDTTITARVAQPVPGGEGSVALVTIRLPSGAFLVSAQWAWDLRDGLPGSADCGLDVRPADPPAEERLLAAACEMFDPLEGQTLGNALVVSAPPEVAAVRLYRGDGTFLAEHPVDHGALVAPVAQGIRTVEAVTAGGVLLGRTELLGHWSPVTD